MIKRPNQRIHEVEEGADIQTKGIEIIAKKFPSLGDRCRHQCTRCISNPK
jgi:hypothetical protein